MIKILVVIFLNQSIVQPGCFLALATNFLISSGLIFFRKMHTIISRMMSNTIPPRKKNNAVERDLDVEGAAGDITTTKEIVKLF